MKIPVFWVIGVQKPRYVYVVVGFRVDHENAVYYRKVNSIEELKKALEECFERYHSHFVSIRRIQTLQW